jgi:hypothetical protein
MGKEIGTVQEVGEEKHSSHKHVAKWPCLEAEVNSWVIGHRNNGISTSTQPIILEGRRWLIAI